MAFEKCKELYSALDNASDFIEHSRTKGAYNVKPIKGIRLANGRYLYNDPDKAVPSNPDEWGKGEDAEGIDEYGAYRLAENGEKIYDIGDGIDYDYTDGYFIPRNKPGAPPKKWDDAVGDYVPVSWEREEEVYPDIGEEDKAEKSEDKPEEKQEPAVDRTKKEKLEEEDKGRKGAPDSEPTIKEPTKESTGEKFKRNLNDLWNKVKGAASSMWERIRNKIRHGEMLDDEEYEFLAHNGIESEEEFLAMVENVDDDDFFEHYGIKEQRWGIRRGPPYPLKDDQHSLPQKGAQYVKEHKHDKLNTAIKIADVASKGAKAAVQIVNAIPYEHSKYDTGDIDDKIKIAGKDEPGSYDEIRTRMDTTGAKITQEELAAVNARNEMLKKANTNLHTQEYKGRQATIDALQSIGGLAITALTLLNFAKDMKKSS